MPAGRSRRHRPATCSATRSIPTRKGLLLSMPRLDETVATELVTIPGQPPNLQALPQGCVFADRCPYVFERCRVERPQLAPYGPAHAKACHLERLPVTAPILSVRDLKVHFPIPAGGMLRRRYVPLKAVDGVSFELRRGRDPGHRRRVRLRQVHPRPGRAAADPADRRPGDLAGREPGRARLRRHAAAPARPADHLPGPAGQPRPAHAGGRDHRRAADHPRAGLGQGRGQGARAGR